MATNIPSPGLLVLFSSLGCGSVSSVSPTRDIGNALQGLVPECSGSRELKRLRKGRGEYLNQTGGDGRLAEPAPRRRLNYDA